MSLILNGYLFNAARWSLKEPHSNHAAEPRRPAPAVPVADHAEGDVGTTQKDDVPRAKEECERIPREKRASHLNGGEVDALPLRGKTPRHAEEKTLGLPTLKHRL